MLFQPPDSSNLSLRKTKKREKNRSTFKSDVTDLQQKEKFFCCKPAWQAIGNILIQFVQTLHIAHCTLFV